MIDRMRLSPQKLFRTKVKVRGSKNRSCPMSRLIIVPIVYITTHLSATLSGLLFLFIYLFIIFFVQHAENCNLFPCSFGSWILFLPPPSFDENLTSSSDF